MKNRDGSSSMPEIGGIFYDRARLMPFTALMRIHDHIWDDRQNFTNDERDYSCGILRGLAMNYTSRVNEKFRRKERETHSHNR
jgi:hypothetical protein